MAGRGRPKQERQRNVVIRVRLYKEEKEQIQKEADRLDMTISEYIRFCVDLGRDVYTL